MIYMGLWCKDASWVCAEHLLLSWAVHEHSITVFLCMLAAQAEHLMHRKSLSLDPGFHLFPGDLFLAKLELSRLVQEVARAGRSLGRDAWAYANATRNCL